MTIRTAMPDHIRAHLHATGVLTPDGISRRAKTTFCASCRAVVIRGLDSHIAATVATADPAALTPLGEVLALATGRRTYDLTWTGGRYEIDHRNEWHIRGRPPGTQFHVIADHKCGQPLPALPAIPARVNKETDNDCPF